MVPSHPRHSSEAPAPTPKAPALQRANEESQGGRTLRGGAFLLVTGFLDKEQVTTVNCDLSLGILGEGLLVTVFPSVFSFQPSHTLPQGQTLLSPSAGPGPGCEHESPWPLEPPCGPTVDAHSPPPHGQALSLWPPCTPPLPQLPCPEQIGGAERSSDSSALPQSMPPGRVAAAPPEMSDSSQNS